MRKTKNATSDRPVPSSPLTFLARLRNYLFAGIIVTAPIGITIVIIWQLIHFLDTTASRLIPARYNPETYMPFSVPGIGVVVFLGMLILIGWFTAGLVGRTLMRVGERIVDRMPVVRSIYGTLKQIFQTVLAQSSRSFREVVLVEYPRRGIWAIGFVTGHTEGEISRHLETECTNIFLPTTPNPTSGFLLFVPNRDLIHLDMSVEDGIKLVISGGIVSPPDRIGRKDPQTFPADASPSSKQPERLIALEKVEQKP